MTGLHAVIDVSHPSPSPVVPKPRLFEGLTAIRWGQSFRARLLQELTWCARTGGWTMLLSTTEAISLGYKDVNLPIRKPEKEMKVSSNLGQFVLPGKTAKSTP